MLCQGSTNLLFVRTSFIMAHASSLICNCAMCQNYMSPKHSSCYPEDLDDRAHLDDLLRRDVLDKRDDPDDLDYLHYLCNLDMQDKLDALDYLDDLDVVLDSWCCRLCKTKQNL